jgi:hypothetical protein
VYIWRKRIYYREKGRNLEVATKEIGVEVNVDKTKYTVMSQKQNAERSHSIKIGNISFERVEEFKYLGTTLTNQNHLQEEIKSRMKSRNACYHSVQNLSSSSLLSKNLKIKIQGTIILLVVLYGRDAWSLTLPSIVDDVYLHCPESPGTCRLFLIQSVVFLRCLVLNSASELISLSGVPCALFKYKFHMNITTKRIYLHLF